MIPIIALILIEIIALGYAGYTNKTRKLKGLVTINMILISLFSPFYLNFFGNITSICAIFYTTILATQMYILHYYGKKETIDTIPQTMFKLSTVLALCFAITYLPILHGNEIYASAIKLISAKSSTVIFASIFAFIISQLLLITTYEKMVRANYNKFVVFVVSIFFAQYADTFIFYPIAFHANHDLLKLMVEGLLIKTIISLLFLPVLLFKINKKNV